MNIFVEYPNDYANQYPIDNMSYGHYVVIIPNGIETVTVLKPTNYKIVLIPDSENLPLYSQFPVIIDTKNQFVMQHQYQQKYYTQSEQSEQSEQDETKEVQKITVEQVDQNETKEVQKITAEQVDQNEPTEAQKITAKQVNQLKQIIMKSAQTKEVNNIIVKSAQPEEVNNIIVQNDYEKQLHCFNGLGCFCFDSNKNFCCNRVHPDETKGTCLSSCTVRFCDKVHVDKNGNPTVNGVSDHTRMNGLKKKLG